MGQAFRSEEKRVDTKRTEVEDGSGRETGDNNSGPEAGYQEVRKNECRQGGSVVDPGNRDVQDSPRASGGGIHDNTSGQSSHEKNLRVDKNKLGFVFSNVDVLTVNKLQELKTRMRNIQYVYMCVIKL